MTPASVCQTINKYILVTTSLRSRLQCQLIGVASTGYGNQRCWFSEDTKDAIWSSALFVAAVIHTLPSAIRVAVLATFEQSMAGRCHTAVVKYALVCYAGT